MHWIQKPLKSYWQIRGIRQFKPLDLLENSAVYLPERLFIPPLQEMNLLKVVPATVKMSDWTIVGKQPHKN